MADSSRSAGAAQRRTLAHALRGLAQLVVDGVVGVTEVVEAMHHTIGSRPWLLAAYREPASRGISGFVYRRVRGVTRGVGRLLDGGLALSAPWWPASQAGVEADALRAALNGAFGDHLARSGNALAIPMRLRLGDRAWTAAEADDAPLLTDRVLVLLHGLCMSDRQWLRAGHDHGRMLARLRGDAPLYLHYNSGLGIEANGAELAHLLERTLARGARLPVLTLLGHSMGGLLARSAMQHGLREGMRWPKHVEAVVCLGSPHLGAPLERAGAWVDRLVGLSPYSAPLLRLGASRSTGIKDLREGRIGSAGESAHEVPLFLVGATRSARTTGGRLAGDGLVPVRSALGHHRDPARALAPAARCAIIPGCGHFELLDHPDVRAQLLAWLAPTRRGGRRTAAALPRRAGHPWPAGEAVQSQPLSPRTRSRTPAS